MTPRSLLIIALSFSPLVAEAQTQVLLINQTLVDNEFIFGDSVAAPPTQRVLTSANPSLLGLGPERSQLLFPADGSITDRTVTNENYDTDTTSSWRVSGLLIDGQYTGIGQGTHTNVEAVANGVDLTGRRVTIQDCRIRRFKGVGASAGAIPGNVINTEVQQCLTGIQSGTSDGYVAGSIVWDCRDYGLHVRSGHGNFQSIGNHYYGCNNGDGPGSVATGGAACFNQGDRFRSTQDAFADSYNGLYSAGPGAQIVAANIFRIFHVGAFLDTAACRMESCTVTAMPRTDQYPNGVAVWLAKERCAFVGGSITLGPLVGVYAGTLTNPIATTAVRVGSTGHQAEVKTQISDATGYNGNIAVHIDGAPTGVEIDVQVAAANNAAGFTGSNSRLLKVKAGSVLQGIRAVFRGPGIDTANPGNLVDIDANWTGSIQLVNTLTGAKVSLTEGTAY